MHALRRTVRRGIGSSYRVLLGSSSAPTCHDGHDNARHSWHQVSDQESNVRGMATASAQPSTSGVAPKAAFMVIGNEILTGSITDVNTPWLSKLLYSRGVDLVRVEFIPDCPDDIKHTVLELQRRVGPSGFVFTSGGIGPTHDDVTYESLAAAFGVPLQLHEPTVQRMRESYEKRGLDLNEARLRMATLPSPSEVLFTPGIWVPLVNLQGVYVLPGIPKLFQAMVSAHQERFTGIAHHTITLHTQLGEGDIASPLTKIAAAHPKVNIGSYPNTQESADQTFKVKLQLNGRDQAAVEAAAASIRETIQPVF